MATMSRQRLAENRRLAIDGMTASSHALVSLRLASKTKSGPGFTLTGFGDQVPALCGRLAPATATTCNLLWTRLTDTNSGVHNA